MTEFLKRFPRIARLLAFVFRRTQIDESIETILGDFLEKVNALQELAEVHGSMAELHNERAAEELTLSNQHRTQSAKAAGIASKIEKLVS
jgi:hypothetical protein